MVSLVTIRLVQLQAPTLVKGTSRLRMQTKNGYDNLPGPVGEVEFDLLERVI